MNRGVLGAKMNNKKNQTILIGVFLIIVSTLIFPTAFAGTLGPGNIPLTLFIKPDAPEIISFTAAGNVEVPVVFGNGDTLTITFDSQTNRPTAGIKSEIDNVFEFTQVVVPGGVPVPISIGDGYVGKWVSTSVFEIRIVDFRNNDGPQVGQLSVKVKASGNLLDITQSSVPSISEFSFLGGNFGELRGPVATSLVAEDLPPIVPDYSVGDRIILRFDVDTNGIALFGTNMDREEVDQLLLFTQDLAGPEPVPFVAPGKYSAQWTSPKNLVITINDITGAAPPQVGILTATVKVSAGLQRELVASANSDSTSPFLQPSFGKPPGPTVTLFSVSDPDAGDAIYGDFDVFDIELSELTNGIALFGTDMTRAEIDQLLVFSEVLAGPPTGGPDAYIGQWLDALHLQITVLDSSGNGSPRVDDPGMGIAGTRVTILASAGLTDEDGTTEVSGGGSISSSTGKFWY